METKHKIGDGEPRKVPGYTYCVLVWTDDIGGEGILYRAATGSTASLQISGIELPLYRKAKALSSYDRDIIKAFLNIGKSTGLIEITVTLTDPYPNVYEFSIGSLPVSNEQPTMTWESIWGWVPPVCSQRLGRKSRSDNIAAVYLGNNQSLPVATLVGTYNQAVGDGSAAVGKGEESNRGDHVSPIIGPVKENVDRCVQGVPRLSFQGCLGACVAAYTQLARPTRTLAK
ncbi:hypothetical protein B0H13DRAFT_1881678 [Mycena leptocephala]|nr:hypothetical protein B0H13DRAFT_1881678 [Mycena leptocephala]